MSRELTKMNLIAIVQQLPEEDIHVIETYIKMIELENKNLKEELSKYIVKPNKKEFIHNVELLEKENAELKEKIILLQASEPMLEFAKQTYKDNWNKLKEWLEEYIENIKMQYQNSEPIRQYSLQVIIDTLQVIIEKLQEIEGELNE